VGRRYYRVAEALAVRWSDALIADAEGIAEYYRAAFDAPTTLLTYGAPLIAPGSHRLAEAGLEPGGYHLVVARFEPENHVDVVVEGYSASDAAMPLVVVGSAPYADEYTRRVHSLADGRVRFLGGVWDQELLDQLYANCATYVHGHSVGGTNPSLLRAIGAGAAVTAFDVDFNREVVRDSGRFFRTPQDVARELAAVEADPEGTRRAGERARVLARRYDWDQVADGYEQLARRLAARDVPRRRPSGRRRPSAADLPLPAAPPQPGTAVPAGTAAPAEDRLRTARR
jgi:glycosyltransferase involved in cell wall biosynthesis